MKKLSLLLFFCGTTIARGQNAGQPLSAYSDINPDTLLNYVATPYTNETYSINMVGDAMMDVGLTARGSVSSGGSQAFINITSLGASVFIAFGRWDSVYVPGTSSWNVTKVARAFSANEPLTASNIAWDNTVLYLTDHSGSGGGNKNVNDWVGGDKYLGIKYVNGSNTTFGWIRVNCKSADSCYLKDYSSGTAPLGLRGNSGTIFSVYPNPATSALFVNPGIVGQNDKIAVQLYDLLGKPLETPVSIKSSHIEINIENLPQGYYLLQCTVGEKTYSQRIIKSNK